MQSVIQTVSFRGIDIQPVSVQVHISNGLPSMAIVGLADKSVAESRERVRAALSSMGLALPAKRVAVNLAPADMIKEGAHFDLPIALGILVAMGGLPADAIEGYTVLGELSLSGEINRVSGILPVALYTAGENRGLICPFDNGPEAAWAGQLDIIAAKNLAQVLNHLSGRQLTNPPSPHQLPEPEGGPDMADLAGQETARRALEVAAAGGHHLLMVGPPGAGKSMLASRLPELLPPLSPQEALETTIIYSVAGHLPAAGLVHKRPYRDPHHSASMAALVGGGLKALPGEASLAHHGVLFLDELAEFSRQSLDGLRQPLETGEIVVARANSHIRYPAQFQLIAAMNPCRCGYLSDAGRACNRAPICAQHYMARISGPMLDRFDIILDIAELSPQQLLYAEPAEPSSEIRKRVRGAREFSAQRSHDKHPQVNARLSASDVREQLTLSQSVTSILDDAMEKHNLSARGLHKVIRVARTIADLASSSEIGKHHILEALSYRHYLSGRLNSG